MGSYGNDFARIFVIFGVDNTLSSHTNNEKISFQYQMKDLLKILMIALAQQKKKLVLISVKER